MRKPKDSVPENLPEQKTDARDAVGKIVGVSGKSIDYATKVINNAKPEVIKAVDEGRMAVSTAAILSSEPAAVQIAEATAPNRRRNYKSVSNVRSQPDEEIEEEVDDEDTQPTRQGVGGIPLTEFKGAVMMTAPKASLCCM